MEIKKKKKSLRAVSLFHNFSFNLTEKANGGLKLPIFETSGDTLPLFKLLG
jgi:hypothetical protein